VTSNGGERPFSHQKKGHWYIQKKKKNTKDSQRNVWKVLRKRPAKKRRHVDNRVHEEGKEKPKRFKKKESGFSAFRKKKKKKRRLKKKKGEEKNIRLNSKGPYRPLKRRQAQKETSQKRKTLLYPARKIENGTSRPSKIWGGTLWPAAKKKKKRTGNKKNTNTPHTKKKKRQKKKEKKKKNGPQKTKKKKKKKKNKKKKKTPPKKNPKYQNLRGFFVSEERSNVGKRGTQLKKKISSTRRGKDIPVVKDAFWGGGGSNTKKKEQIKKVKGRRAKGTPFAFLQKIESDSSYLFLWGGGKKKIKLGKKD